MIGLGTVINTAAILAGGLCGGLFGRFLTERTQDTLTKVCGVSTLFIAMSGCLRGMFYLDGGTIHSQGDLLIILSLAIGAVIGELLDIEGAFARFGTWLREKSGNSRDKGFVDAFVSASVTVSIGAMAIVGAIQDGISGDYSILLTKAVLDLIIITVMTGSMGKGCVFSAIPVALLQGSITLFAGFLKPVMTEAALHNLSLVGNILIFCVGVNLLWGKRIRVANLLPAIVVAVAAAFLPVL